jgi:hypothetical protein
LRPFHPAAGDEQDDHKKTRETEETFGQTGWRSARHRIFDATASHHCVRPERKTHVQKFRETNRLGRMVPIRVLRQLAPRGRRP